MNAARLLRSSSSLLSLSSVLWLGCASEKAPGSARAEPSAEASPARSAAPPSSAATSPGDALVVQARKICSKATCTGSFASVTPYVDRASDVKRWEFHPDIQVCSHGPTQIFDEQGVSVLVLAERPVAPGSPEALKARADWERELGGLTAGKPLSCPTR